MTRKQLISLLLLLLGVILLTTGVQEFRLLSSSYNTLFTITPQQEIQVLMILGVAATVAGFVGLIRDKVL
ncbi:MAG: DUF3185 family protein [Bacteroidetes bacterium]|jgi:drug/metabolite transporter (DMT)-like permease|nr:DUF3185 family protein [Bacteroidota bacterium]